MSKRLVLFFLCMSHAWVFGQGAYINTSTGAIFELTGGAGNCTYTPVTNDCSGLGATAYSLAFYKDTIYFTNSSGTLYRFKIGVPGSCQQVGSVGGFNSMTIDQNGVVYLASSSLFQYNPYTNTLTNLGALPFSSAGDLIFFNGKLLLAGVPAGIYEINISNPPASTLYMSTNGQGFFGLVSFPVPCSNSRYFGLAPATGGTAMVELDLVNKQVLSQVCTLPLSVYDAASSTENGLNAGISITGIAVTHPCLPATTGSAQVSVFYPMPDPVTYLLDNTISNTTGYFNNLSAGHHTVTVTANGNSCSGNGGFDILPGLDPLVNISKNNANDCSNANGNITLNGNSPHTPITYTLLNTGQVQTNGDFSNLSGGTYNFRIRDTIGCTKDTIVTIGYDPPVLIKSFQAGDSHCGLNNGFIAVTLNQDSAGATSSLNNGPYNPFLHYYNLAPGIYRVQVKKGSNCYFDTTIQLNDIADPKPQIQLVVKDQLCFEDNGSISINASGIYKPYRYQLNGGGFQAGNTFSALAPGSYNIRLQNSNGCSWDSFAVVAAYPKKPVNTNVFSVAPTCRGITDGSIRITASGTDLPYSIVLNGKTYASGQTVTGLTDGDYVFTVLNKNQCAVDSGKLKLNIVFEPQCNDVFIPNAFTPDNNGLNDSFHPAFSFFISDISLSVHNRYGQLLYRGSGRNVDWDGMYKGVRQEAGAYVYLLSYTDYFGEKKIKKGTFLLIR